jgi:hypothetical protein
MASNNPNGRPKGTTNQKQSWLRRQAILDELDPLKVIWDVMKRAVAEGEDAKAVSCAKEIMPYMHPKMQAVTNEGSTEQTMKIVLDNNQIDIMADRLLARYISN